MTDHPTTEAADLARIILDDSEGEHPTAMYVLNVHEARTLANAVTRVEALVADLVDDAEYVRKAFKGVEGRRRAEERMSAAAQIRAALKGDAA